MEEWISCPRQVFKGQYCTIANKVEQITVHYLVEDNGRIIRKVAFDCDETKCDIVETSDNQRWPLYKSAPIPQFLLKP